MMEYLANRSKLCLVALAFGLVGLIGIGDYLTGPEAGTSIFYLLPVALTAWFAGNGTGVVVSIASALCWLLANVLSTGVSHGYAFAGWSALVRLGFFLATSTALAELAASREKQRELTEFLVHDLRSPLTNVHSGLHTLRGAAADRMDGLDKEVLELAVVSMDRVLTLVNSLLDLSKLSNGKMPVRADRTDLGELVRRSLCEVSLWAERDQVCLEMQVEADAGSAYADPDLTNRVLVNLVSNALKVSPTEGKVTVTARQLASGEVALSVADQGPGIPAEWAQHVFEKFGQLEARKAGASGTGLGLTFCRAAVEAQGGRIWLSSENGNGTTVTFTLPAEASAQVSRRARSPQTQTTAAVRRRPS
ncbi:MAG: hypothetical protein COY42_05355 [Armatimonadetes bacterium CG_4_10_14_0_8_um_filter_66_14]|nr:MAG: hypothetical protein COY42_05355 [Armatimonadetes bacterium CG_4_10_14_0_8_um_filter_66_14]